MILMKRKVALAEKVHTPHYIYGYLITATKIKNNSQITILPSTKRGLQDRNGWILSADLPKTL